MRVDCRLEVLAERERRRSDWRAGLAVDQAHRVHEGYVYDLSVDTSASPPEERARAIVGALAANREVRE